MRILSLLVVSLVAVGSVVGCSATDDSSSSSDDLKSCKGPLPMICEECSDGTTACAHWVKEHGKCEIQICAPAKVECNVASDCSGPLPMLCEICDGGGSKCAHHACVDHKCETAICD